MKKRILSLILASTMVLSMGMVASATDETSEANAATNSQATSKVVVALTPKASDVLSVSVPMFCPLAITWDSTNSKYAVTAPSANSYKIVNNSQAGTDSADGTKPSISVDNITIKQTDTTAASNFALKRNTLNTTANEKTKEMKLGLGTTTDNISYFADLGYADTKVVSLFDKTDADANGETLKTALGTIAEEQPLVVAAEVGAMPDTEIAKTNTFTISYTFKL